MSRRGVTLSRIAVVPGVLALEPRYASLVDPVPELRAAVTAACEWAEEVFVLNGSARRTKASPGPFDPRAVPFDDALCAALAGPDLAALRLVDTVLAKELWASVETLPELADALGTDAWTVTVDFDEAPYGVAWWVLRYAKVGI